MSLTYTGKVSHLKRGVHSSVAKLLLLESRINSSTTTNVQKKNLKTGKTRQSLRRLQRIIFISHNEIQGVVAENWCVRPRYVQIWLDYPSSNRRSRWYLGVSKIPVARCGVRITCLYFAPSCTASCLQLSYSCCTRAFYVVLRFITKVMPNTYLDK